MKYCQFCKKSCGLKTQLTCHGRLFESKNTLIKLPMKLYVQNDLQGEFAIYLACTSHFKPIDPEDSGAMGVDVGIVYLEGRAPRWSFKGFARFKADIGKVGKTFADVWLKSKVYSLPASLETQLGPCRYSIRAGKCYLIRYK